MSGEAAWSVTRERFALSILSGQPVWTAAEARPIELKLKITFEGAVDAFAHHVDAIAPSLKLEPMEPPAPSLHDAVTDDAHAGQPLPGGHQRARIHLTAHHKPTMQGFNLVLTVGARVARSALERLAVSLARQLWPDFQPELPVRIQ